MGKRALFLVVAHLAVICHVCSPVQAQGLSNSGSLVGLPSPAVMGNSSRSAQAGASGIFSGLARSVLNVGYTNLRADASFNQEGNPFLLGIKHKYIVYGVWYEVLQQVFLTDKLGVMAVGHYLQPTSERLEEDAEFIRGFHARRTWATSTQLWGAGGALTYDLLGPTTVIGGVNYASFDLKFQEITEDSGGQTFVRPKSQAAVRLATPFLGLVVSQNSPSSILSLGVIVSPMFVGNLEYRLAGLPIGTASGAWGSFRNSQFVTINADYTRKILGGAGSIGALGRYTVIPAGFTLGLRPGIGPMPPGDTDVPLRANANMWIVGGTVNFYFTSPI